VLVEFDLALFSSKSVVDAHGVSYTLPINELPVPQWLVLSDPILPLATRVFIPTIGIVWIRNRVTTRLSGESEEGLARTMSRTGQFLSRSTSNAPFVVCSLTYPKVE
jgi:hypothetical protein